MPVFEALPYELEHILRLIHNRTLALPDFQRDFVWDPAATEDLIVSVAQNYPAGSLLFLRQGDSPHFAMRTFEGAPPLDGYQPPELVLDGQQRLTALYQAFFGTGEHLYFLNLRSLIDDGDIEASVWHATRARAMRKYGTIEDQARDLVLPLRVVYGESGGFIAWRDATADLAGDSAIDIREQLRSVYETWIKTIEQYKFPVVTLPADTGLEPVCKIFETLNRTGVRLGVFELLTARFYPSGVRLRELWDKAKASQPIVEDFNIDPYYILQIIALLTGAPSCRRGHILNLEARHIDDRWEDAVDGLAAGLDLLRSECGIFSSNLIPYGPMLLPLGAVGPIVRGLEGPAEGSARAKIKRWFWCSTFMQSYEQGANTKAQSDFHELSKWIAGGRADTPQSVSGFDFELESLDQVTPRQRAVYRGAMALMLREGARDFHSTTPLDPGTFAERRVSDHHLFPQAYLQTNRPDISTTTRDSILNRALIDPQTNSRIGARPPSEYLAEIEDEIGQTAMDQILSSHLLPAGPNSPLRRDDFDTFLESRQEMLAAQIVSATME